MTFIFQVYYGELTLLLFCNYIDNLWHRVYNSKRTWYIIFVFKNSFPSMRIYFVGSFSCILEYKTSRSTYLQNNGRIKSLKRKNTYHITYTSYTICYYPNLLLLYSQLSRDIILL